MSRGIWRRRRWWREGNRDRLERLVTAAGAGWLKATIPVGRDKSLRADVFRVRPQVSSTPRTHAAFGSIPRRSLTAAASTGVENHAEPRSATQSAASRSNHAIAPSEA